MSAERVLHFLPSVNVEGGIESFVMSLYRSINTEEIQFDFLILDNTTQGYAKEIEILGGKIYDMPIYSATILDDIKWIVKYLPFMYKLMKENNYIAVHAHLGYLSGMVLFIAKLAKIETRIAHSHASIFKKSKSIFRNKFFLNRFLDISSTHKVACSDLAAKGLFGQNYYKDKKVKVIHNGINLERFNVLNYNYEKCLTKYGVDKQKINFIHVGRFVKVKNHSFVIEILQQLVQLNNNIHMTLVGKGDLEKEIKAQIKQLKLDEYVSFLPSNTNIPEILRTMDYCIFPSISEGFPIVLLEMQAMGIKSFISNTITQECNLGLCDTLDLNSSSWEWARYINQSINEGMKHLELDKTRLYKLSAENIKEQFIKIYKGIDHV